MTRKTIWAIGALCLAYGACNLTALGAAKARLVYGESWSPAGRAVKATLSSGEFKSAAKGKYVAEFVDEEGDKQDARNLGTYAMPAIFLISESGNCFFVFENVPYDVSAKYLVKYFNRANEIRLKYEKQGWNTVDECGEFLQKMERFVGGPRRVISEGFYNDVYEKLKKLDPKDESGWLRHFTMPYVNHAGKTCDCKNADGYEIVEEATWYRVNGLFADGEKFLVKLQKELPTRHLSLEQKQSLLMARFALYREKADKRDEMVALLNRVVESGENTLWGTAALGYLNIFKVPPLSTYWGWHDGDFKGPKLEATVRYGVGHSFSKPGKYTITFERDANSSDAPRIEEVELFAGDESVAKLAKPVCEGAKTAFEFPLKREYRGKLTSMVVKGSAGSGNSSGRIRIERKVLRDRKEAKSASTVAGKRDLTPAHDYILREAGSDTIQEICRHEGGVQFLKKFLSDKDWMEQFAGSGVPGGTPAHSLGTIAKSLKALDLLAWNDTTGFLETKLGRNCATALALNHGHDWDEVKLVEYLDCYRAWDENGTLDDSCRNLDVRQWRDVVTFGQNAEQSADALCWIHDYANLPPIRYGYFFWKTCSYRDKNCFGESVHGSGYTAPWLYKWHHNEILFRVGGVCGRLSKFGSHCAASHGLRSYTAGQPGHCAFMLWHFGKENRWGIDYSVTGHTGAHFSTGGEGFTACEEQDRYYRHPKRMQAEAYRWQGDYKRAMATAPGNWQAAREWAAKLKAKNAPEAEWDEWGKFVRTTFKTDPSQGWQLYVDYLGALKGRAARIAAAKEGFLSFTENPAKTSEIWDMGADGANIACLPKVAACFKDDKEALFELLPAMLDGQAKSPNYYGQVINWAAGVLMDSKEHNRKFMTILVKNAEKNGTKIDFKNMILTSAANNDVQGFQQVFKLMAKTSPEVLPKMKDKKYPETDYGQPLVSNAGLLKISDSQGWDVPYNYMTGIVAQDFGVDNAFHTHKSDNPWATVVLAGDCEVSGITIVNSGGNDHNRRRQIPLAVSVSEDGKEFSQIWTTDKLENEWRVPISPAIRAKFIKVERPKDDGRKEDPFHLHKILVYGRKLY